MLTSPVHFKTLCRSVFTNCKVCLIIRDRPHTIGSISSNLKLCWNLRLVQPIRYITNVRPMRYPDLGNPPTNDVLTKAQARELALKLTLDERKLLLTSLLEFESQRIKNEYEGQLAGHRWRGEFGRPTKVSGLGDVDPTGTYCAVPDDWLKKKYAATVPPPCTSDLLYLAIANAIPFIGFGFLDNFIMIVAGDYIEKLMGAYICLSTMAAAALGNTFSDVIGIGAAPYVEKGAAKIGFKPPELSPIQLDMQWSRRMANLGRVVGITIGCFLGMVPLLFMDEKPNTPQEST